MKNINKFITLTAYILLLTLFLCGCSKTDNNTANNSTDGGSLGVSNALTWDLPALSEFDENMSRAHFISAPESFSDISLLEGYSEWPTDYSLNYDIYMSGGSASFLLSDGGGQYGNIQVLRLNDYDGVVSFEVATMKGGFLFEKSQMSEVKITSKADIAENANLTIGDGETAYFENYHIEANVSGSSLSVSINDTDMGNFEISGFPLGSIGVYNSRGAADYRIDDVNVTSSKGAVVYSENFEDSSKNIFSPYYIKINDGCLQVKDGVLLTKLEGAPAPVFRKEFEVDKSKLEGAYLYLTALGAFEASANGIKVSADYFDPGHLAWNDRLNYVTYDITESVKSISGDKNKLEITLLHGFYDRGQSYPENFYPYGDRLALKGEVVLKYKNGDTEIIPTDESFTVSADGSVRFDDIYQGEIIDGGRELSDGSFVPVLVDAVDDKYISMTVEPKETEPIRSRLELHPAAPVKVVDTAKTQAGSIENVQASEKARAATDRYVYDFGQNFSGTLKVNLGDVKWDELGVSKGDVITFRYGEALNTDNLLNKDDESGTVWTDNLLTAKSTDYYIVGDSNSEFEFAHTYHGFRYLQISGPISPIPAECITANVLSTDFENTGEFSCSNEVLNRLYENAKFSILSNSMDVPTDCNQRDERLGWAGDAQNAALLSGYAFNSKRFFSKYLKDMRSNQQEDGSFMDIAPSSIGGGGRNCWGDASVVIAWNLYLQYGDKDILSDNYEACKNWVDYLESTSEDGIRYFESYGDHLSLQGMPNELSDTAWSAHSADLVSRMANILGYSEDEKRYSNIYEKYRKAWQEKYIREDGSIEAGILSEESETAYALGMSFGLFDENMMQDVADRLVILADYSGYMFGPGYSGLGYLLPVLARYGHSDTAMKILESQTPGSLIFTLASGLTTLSESLHTVEYQTDGDSALYSINGSLNHQAFSGALVYLYTDILGIKPDENAPGYKHFYLEPSFGGTLNHAEGSYNSASGKIEVSWKLDEGLKNGSFHCVIPEGTTCTLILPGKENEELNSGTYDFDFTIK